MIEVTLAYIGNVLIAYEFVRKFTKLQAFAGMTASYPFLLFARSLEKMGKVPGLLKIPITLFILAICLFFLIIMLPLTAFFYFIWCVILILDWFHHVINRAYIRMWIEYRPFSKIFVDLALIAHGKYSNRNEKRVMNEIEKSEIPILPIIGILLLTIDLILELT